MTNIRNITPELGDYKTLQPFRYWCQKVLPLAYDDSLSYYELLCKVVDYLNKTMEDVETLHGDVTNLHTAYEELQSYVNNYFNTLDVQEEIDNKLNTMASDGTLSRLLGGYAVMYNNINNPKSVSMSKVGTFGVSGHTFQGMCGDGTYLYLAHHVADTANMWIKKIDIASMSEVTDVNTGGTGHFNSLSYLNGKLYASGGKGSNYKYMSIIDANTLLLDKEVKLPIEYWSIYPAIIQDGYDMILCGFPNYSPILQILTTRQGANKYTVFSRQSLPSVDGIMQGGQVVNNALWQLYGSDYVNFNSHNLVQVTGLNGCYMSTIYLVTENNCEGEDIFVTAYNGNIFMNDLNGNIYRGSLAKVFKQEYTNGFNIAQNQPVVSAPYNPYNGSETWVNGEGKMCKQFYLNPYTYLICNQLVGWMYINGVKTPLTYNPNTGVIEASNSFFQGNGIILFMYLKYERISDSTSYGYKLSKASYLSKLNTVNNTSETKYGEDIVNHSAYADRWYVSYLVGLNVGSFVPFSV